jgi:rare lipoprotein A
MAPPALLFPLNAIRTRLSAKCGEAVAAFLLAAVFLTTMVWDGIETGYSAAANAVSQADPGSGAIVLAFTNSGSSAAGDVVFVLLVDTDGDDGTCPLAGTAGISRLDLQADAAAAASLSLLPGIAIQSEGVIFANAGNGEPQPAVFARRQAAPKLTSVYRSIRRLAAIMGLPQIQEEAVPARATIIGTISTYNPYRDGKEEGGAQTASGEVYDPSAWTAAIQTGLRDQFGGVRYGRLYQPAYALVSSREKQLIVRINDVGPLKSGRVLDLNERSMRYFDPLLMQGLIQDAKVTLLPGEDWTAGPVGEAFAIDFAAARRQRSVASATEEAELANMRARLDQMPGADMKANAHIETRLTGG